MASSQELSIHPGQLGSAEDICCLLNGEVTRGREVLLDLAR